MKVSELFAEIGFKVDKKGLTDFSNSLKLIKQTITQSVSGLEKMAAMAERLANAANTIRSSFSASDKDLTARYRAETTYIRAVATHLRGEGARGRGLGAYWKNRADLVYRDADRLEASLRLRQEQWEAKKAGLLGGRSSSSESIFLSTLGAIIVSAIPKGMAKGYNYIKNLFTKTLSTALSYRDYLTFTGRGAGELSAWFARSFNATDLSRQDVMSAAMGFEKGAWDIFFGKRSPSAYLKLGLFPTGNGAKDMANILTRIAEFPDRGLRASILSEFPEFASKQGSWLQVIDDIANGKPYSEVYELAEQDIRAAEKANETINKFNEALDQAKIRIMQVLVDEGGFTDILNQFTDALRTMLAIMNTDEFRNASFLDKVNLLLSSRERTGSTSEGTYVFTPRDSKSWFLTKGVLAGMGAGALTMLSGIVSPWLAPGTLLGAGALMNYAGNRPYDFGGINVKNTIFVPVNGTKEQSQTVADIMNGGNANQQELNYTDLASKAIMPR